MADSTPQKRVLPARERRESAAKRRATSPGIQPASTPISTTASPSTEPRQKRKYTKRASLLRNDSNTRTSTPTPGVEDSLPTRVSASKPLPTARDRQPDDLANREYQSLADSAILAASLFRSRAQWLQEGVFKRYWVKPTKKKGVIEQPPGNPDIKSMHKLGNATITIEPHTFDATFYLVRDLTAILAQPIPHTNQHTVRPAAPTVSNVAQSIPILSIPTSASVPPKGSEVSAIKQEKNQQIKSEGSTAPAPGTTSVPSSAATPVPTPTPTVTSGPAPATRPAPLGGPPKPSDDPVIQMLAARAAADPRLKELMKIVAASQATLEQLKEFQLHIDEFNTIVKEREARASLEARHKGPAAQHATTASSSTPPSGKITPISAKIHAPAGHSNLSHPPPPLPARPEALIKHVIIEFHSSVSSAQGASTDRWLFPEHAVLEMRASGMEMVVSFFAERSGDDILKASKADDDDDGEGPRPRFQAGKQYYQPITMLVKATQHRTIETIARAARPLADVQAYMKTVMKEKTRAPQEFLSYRLPRDKPLTGPEVGDFADSGIDTGEGEDDELRDYYGM